MTRGGPGFTSDVIASVIYKQYQAGFYGLSTAGNVVLFVLVARDHRSALRLASTARRSSDEADVARYWSAASRRSSSRSSSSSSLRLHRADRAQGPEGSRRCASSPGRNGIHFWDNLVEVIKTRDYMLLTAFINRIILTVASVILLVVFGAMVGFVLQRRPVALDAARRISSSSPA